MPRPSLCAYSLISTFILSLISPSIASVPTLEMDAPQPITECAEDTFTWRGGLPPYTLSLRDARSGAPVFSNGSLTDTVFHWVAAVAAGTSLIVELTDTGENGAGPARISDSFTVEPGSDSPSCLGSNEATSTSSSSSSSSSSAAQQTSDGSTSPSSASTSTSSGQPTTSVASSSPPPSASDSTAIATTNIFPSRSASPSSTGGAPAGSLTGNTASRTGPDGSSTTSTPTSTGSGSPDPSSPGSASGGSTATAVRPGAIAGAAVGSLVAGFALAAGLFCAWRARVRTRRGAAVTAFGTRQRQRRGRLEPYDYPSGDPARTVRPASSSSLPHGLNPLDLEGGPHHLGVTGDPVVRERQRPGKGRWEDGSRLPLPSIPVQPTTSPSQRPMAGVGLNGADRSRVMDADGAGGDQEILSGDIVGRGWESGDLGLGNWDDLDAFDLVEDYSAHSVSTAPPPYSQIA